MREKEKIDERDRGGEREEQVAERNLLLVGCVISRNVMTQMGNDLPYVATQCDSLAI